jgi:serine phosphatase RsbU (regulator of sigma subunit)
VRRRGRARPPDRKAPYWKAPYWRAPYWKAQGRAGRTGRAGREGTVREHLAFLHGATLRIGGDLEPEQVVSALCETAVPHVADLAAAYLYEAVLTEGDVPDTSPGAVLRQAAAAGRGGALAGKVSVAELTGPFAASVASGQLVVWPDPEGADRPGAGRAGRDRDVEALLPPRWRGSLLVVPLRAGERLLGFATLLRESGRAAFDETDLLTASLIADQAALGVHKALLYQREARIADALQRSMLPKHPPRLPGVEIAYRYLPGNPGARVGGDWFDAIRLPGSRVALVVGDVMGHGVRSAAAMGQLRTAVRTLAALDPAPDQVLRQLDQLFEGTVGQSEEYLATCLYCVYDPVARRCAIANAGHLPPVLVHPDGRAEQLPVPAGVPLGVGNVAFQTVETAAPDGGLIALCTDGLVESRDRDLSEGMAALRECLSASPDERPVPDELCETVLRTMHTDRREDDVALLIARFDGIPSANVANWVMNPHPRTPRHVRRLIAATLTGWGLSEHVNAAVLLAGELVSNAIRYTTRPISVRLLRTDTLLCEVTDDDHHLPVVCEPDEDSESGRGLFLVSRIADRWGASHTATGKAVWFELLL